MNNHFERGSDDMTHVVELNLESTKMVDEDDDLFLITEFIEDCKCGAFIDYDGFADELVLDGKVVFSFHDAFQEYLYPSDLLDNEETFLELAKENEGLQLVWYNR